MTVKSVDQMSDSLFCCDTQAASLAVSAVITALVLGALIGLAFYLEFKPKIEFNIFPKTVDGDLLKRLAF